MKVHTDHEAKTNLSKLIQKACDGEEVVIAKGQKPMLMLVPIAAAQENVFPAALKERYGGLTTHLTRSPQKSCASGASIESPAGPPSPFVVVRLGRRGRTDGNQQYHLRVSSSRMGACH
jgi:antitoxin (DNA-binding transcriptional repressor) of toxin-antitoxin stability system